MLTLVLGGTKAGKSSFAVNLARETGTVVRVLATGVAGDEEMRRRVKAHRQARPVDWTVVEEPLALDRAVPAEAGVVLLESVDSWLFNRMEAAGGAVADFGHELFETLLDSCDSEIRRLEARTNLIAVSAEVGLSLLPLSAYGRAFTDLLGMLNRRLAARAERCYLVAAGIPIPLHLFRGVPE